MPEPDPESVFPGADESTPSLSQYFSWINNTNEGSTEAQTLVNLDFFRWLHDEYGMVLDVYAFDAGNLDGPRDDYGNLHRAKFRAMFPNGFGPIHEKARAMGTRLGIWLGPDGFGDTPEEEQARIELLVRLCREYEFVLFKMDGVCGQLRPEKQDAFVRALTECRKARPDLILLNHRLPLGKGLPHATTFLWEGGETYIDVFMPNGGTASHHRAGVLSRGLPPDLTRLTEDHGVCLSSCLDYWEDDLILQAFNRSLILAPEIYANPWFLRDDEYPKLARIYSLYRRYREILVNGITLPEEQYGPHAVSRGDEKTRFLTLRNLTWKPVVIFVKLDESVGLNPTGEVELRRLHPTERILGRYGPGEVAEVEVLPFRSCLLMATADPNPEVGVEGADYEVICDVPGKPLRLKLLGAPGTPASVTLPAGGRVFTGADLDGEPVDGLVEGEAAWVKFPGRMLQRHYHRKLADLTSCAIPDDAEALYEATCFAADNNALEVRSLLRSGPTQIPQVQAARNTFLAQPMFQARGLWDRWMFDEDEDTFFKSRPEVEKNGLLRVDFGEPVKLDRLVIRAAKGSEAIPGRARGEVSADLKTWTAVDLPSLGTEFIGDVPGDAPVRYFRMSGFPDSISEVEGYFRDQSLAREQWRGSHMFRSYKDHPAVAAWSASFKLDEAPRGSYLAVAINGRHGKEGACAALRVDGAYVGAPDRAVSYPAAVWEWYVHASDHDYTYYFPVIEEMLSRPIEAVVLALRTDDVPDEEKAVLKPEVWITAYPIPYEERELTLYE